MNYAQIDKYAHLCLQTKIDATVKKIIESISDTQKGCLITIGMKETEYNHL